MLPMADDGGAKGPAGRVFAEDAGVKMQEFHGIRVRCRRRIAATDAR
jgi:hypothetical protein